MRKKEILVICLIAIAAVLIAMLLFGKPANTSGGGSDGSGPTTEQASGGDGSVRTGSDDAEESIPSVTVSEDFEIELGENESIGGF